MRNDGAVAERPAPSFGEAPQPAQVPTAANVAPTPKEVHTAPPASSPPAKAVPEVLPPIVVRSGWLEDIGVTDVVAPANIHIGDLQIDAPIVPVGYVEQSDEMAVPRSAVEVGWYEFSSSPGSAGSAVLAAHVDWNGRAGVFFDLHSIAEGTEITIEFADGSADRFEVFAARQYDKEALPVDVIFSKGGGPLLTLVTCGGLFDGTTREYRDNIVVFARPVAPPSAIAPA